MLDTNEGRTKGLAVPPRRRWITLAMAVAVLVTGGVLATGTSASAANPTVSAAHPTVENVVPLAGKCMQVTAEFVNVYKYSTGSATHGVWTKGTKFEYIEVVNGRFKTWWHDGKLAYVGSSGIKSIGTCPW